MLEASGSFILVVESSFTDSGKLFFDWVTACLLFFFLVLHTLHHLQANTGGAQVRPNSMGSSSQPVIFTVELVQDFHLMSGIYAAASVGISDVLIHNICVAHFELAHHNWLRPSQCSNRGRLRFSFHDYLKTDELTVTLWLINESSPTSGWFSHKKLSLFTGLHLSQINANSPCVSSW